MAGARPSDSIKSAITGNRFPRASLYDEIATSGKAPGLKAEIEAKVQAYFEALELPESPTLYDHLVLSLRDSDYIATFNWFETGKSSPRQGKCTRNSIGRTCALTMTMYCIAGNGMTESGPKTDCAPQ